MAKNTQSSLRTAFEKVVDGYIDVLLKRFDWNAVYGAWVACDKSGVYMYDDYFISLSDIIYIVDHNVSLNDFMQWQDYESFASDFGVPHINLHSWMSGCPRLTPDQRCDLQRRREELDELIHMYNGEKF